jgi:RNA polymerase sigma-70 factor (ECF subfamily)
VAINIETLYETYLPLVLRRCRRMLGNEEDAFDAAQDVFLHVIKARQRLHETFPSSLLYTIATNVCLNKLRTKRRHGESVLDVETLPIAAQDTAYDEVDAMMVMEAILKTESESTRAICFMYHADGMTLKEIGETVGMSISGVKKRLDTFNKRARIKFAYYKEEL